MFHRIGTSYTCGLGGQALGRGSVVPEGQPTNQNDATWTLARQAADDLGRWFNIQAWYGFSPYSRLPAVRLGTWAHPDAVPQPVPWSRPNQLPEYVPNPDGATVPAVRPMPATLPRGRPGNNPYTRSNVNSRPSPRPSPNPSVPEVVVRPTPLPENIPREPPGKGTKERKVRARGNLAFLNAALGAVAGVYEDAKFINDLVNAFYNALPNNEGARTPQSKLAEIYRRYNDVDIEKAVLGVLQAYAGEKAGAYIDRARRTIAENLGLNMYITIPIGSAPRL